MKKNIIVLIQTTAMLVCAMSNGNAQRPVGDTLRNMDTTYFSYKYNWFLEVEDTTLYSTLHDILLPYGVNELSQTNYLNNPFEGNYKAGSQMFTEEPIKILGIAACVEREEAFYIVHGQNRYFNTIDTTLAGRVLDSLILYKATPEGPALLTAGTWRIEDPHRYIVLPSRKQSLTPVACETQHDTIPKAPLYEVMFEKPQVVTDSFIVVGTSNNNTQSVVRLSDYSNDEELLWDRNRTLYWGLRSYTEEPDTCNISWLKYKHYDWVREGPRISWLGRYREPHWMRFVRVIFPIIDPDFDTMLCDMARDVRVADSTDTTLTLMWNGGNAVQWEVVYAEVNSPTANTVTTTAPMVTLTGLRERTNYMVRVRGMCEWDTEYGPWSDIELQAEPRGGVRLGWACRAGA